MLQDKKQENFRITESKKLDKEYKQTCQIYQKQQVSNIQCYNEIHSQTSAHLQSCSQASLETQIQANSEQKYYEKRLNDYLPTKIGGLQIKEVTWSDFPGKPDPVMCYWAHIYWFISFNYSVEQRQNSVNRYLDYKVKNINVSVKISNKSWFRKQTDYLLSHEQGHYLVGCLCALDFKQQVLKKKFSINYSNEINQIFNNTLKYYQSMEMKYDEETNHSKNIEKQTLWFIFIYDSLKKYEEQFNSQIIPTSSNLLKNINDNKENQSINTNQQTIQTNKKSILPSIQKSSTSLSRINISQNNKQFDRQEARARRFSQILTTHNE